MTDYLQIFSGSTFVVKVGGRVVETHARSIADDVTALSRRGIRVVLVHGGGPQIAEFLQVLGIEEQTINGRRITDGETLRSAKMVFRGQINTDLVAAISARGGKAVGLSGVDGGMIQTTRRPAQEVRNWETGRVEQVDFGEVGDVVAVDPHLMITLLDGGFIPVVCCLGATADGEVHNVNGDTVAAEIAKALGADKLISMTNVDGVYEDFSDPSSLISYATVSRLRALIEGGLVVGGMLPKITTAIEAVEGGVKRTHLLSGEREHALLNEVTTPNGTGTMIIADQEESVYLSELEDHS